jgi:hypothetical protein
MSQVDDIDINAPPSSLMESTVNPKVKTMEGERVGARSLACSTLGVEGHAGAMGWGLGRLTSNSISYMDLHKPNHKLVTCRNPSFGLVTKAKGLQGCGPRGSPGITSHTPRSVGKCEGVNPHTPKATPTLGDGVPVDSRIFREQFQGLKLNDLSHSLYHWKVLRT